MEHPEESHPARRVVGAVDGRHDSHRGDARLTEPAMEQRYDGLDQKPDDSGGYASDHHEMRRHDDSVSEDEYDAVERRVYCADESRQLVHPLIDALLRVSAGVGPKREKHPEWEGRQEVPW